MSFSAAPERSAAAAVLAVPGEVVGPKAVVDQRPDVGVGLDDDVRALAAVAAVGSAQRDVLLAAEAAAALAAVAGPDGDRDLVDEHRSP